jgi:CIC family chloride channel protein
MDAASLAESPRLLEAGPQPEAEESRLSLLALCALALFVGVATGFGAVFLRDLIGLVHNAFYNGVLNYHYNANLLEAPSRFGVWIALSPVIGGVLVVFLVQRFAPEAKGHGVPEVMDSVFYKRGEIRWQVAVIKSLASALSIGSGAAVGREGPIIQIGAALGSSFARAFGLSTWQKITLLAAGAGAGIAATFNTPLGGVLFAVEILLPEVSNRTFLPVVLATGAATTVGRWLIGPDPAFVVPDFQFTFAQALQLPDAIGFAVIGLLCGVAAWAFIRLLVVMEDGFPKLPGGPYIQNIIGMAALGLAMVAMTRLFGHSYIDGVGYGVIQSILGGGMSTIGLMALLFGVKLLATSVSLGCGASGGIFSPSLYLGATLGGAFAALAHLALPQMGMTIPAGAIVGMAAVVGAGTGGVMTAIVMIFEMTRDYGIIVPVIVAVAIAAGVRRALISETIYTIKLRHRGHRIPKERHINLYLVQQAKDVMERTFLVVAAGTPIGQAFAAETTDEPPPVVVEREGRVVGLVPPRSGMWIAAQKEPETPIDRFVEPRMVVCRDVDLLSLVFGRLRRHRASAAIVFSGEARPRTRDVVGIITKRVIADTVIDNYAD